eukprot:735334-Amphidinium_carterae.1
MNARCGSLRPLNEILPFLVHYNVSTAHRLVETAPHLSSQPPHLLLTLVATAAPAAVRGTYSWAHTRSGLSALLEASRAQLNLKEKHSEQMCG